MVLRPDRTRRGPDPTLPFRIALFVLGAVAGLTGIAAERMWLVTLGTVFLAAGLAIAIVAQRQRARTPDDPGNRSDA